MNPRKRPATELLLPLHAAKQRRTKMVGYDGGNPSASEEAGLLSRWKSFGREFGMLATETVKAIVQGLRQDDTQCDINPHPHPDKQGQARSDPCITDEQTPLQASKTDCCAQLKHIPAHHYTDSDAPVRMLYPPSTPPNHINSHHMNGNSHPPFPARQDSTGSPFVFSPVNGIPPPRRKQEVKVLPRAYQNREHIFVKAHKANVRAETQKSKEDMQRQIWTLKRNRGYTSNFTDFQSLLAYEAALEKLDQRDAFSPSSSMVDLHTREAESTPRRHSYSDSDDMEFLRRAFDRAKATLNEPRPPRPFQPSLEQLRLSQRLKDEGIEQQLRPKLVPPASLPLNDDAQVDIILKKRGTVSKYGRAQIVDADLSRLRPGQWLNDEVINFYGTLIMSRSDDCKENPPKQGANGTKLLNVFYFNTFFWPKLKEGYDNGLARWTKKADIFAKDVILIPVNHSNAHWTSAAINFRRKRIESYDSMGTRRDNVFKTLRGYLDAEHRNKKKKPFDFTGWEDYSIEEPQQENGYDCGVFTCQYLQGLSRGDEVVRFTQKDMPSLRRRMIWEIGHAKLRDEP